MLNRFSRRGLLRSFGLMGVAAPFFRMFGVQTEPSPENKALEACRVVNTIMAILNEEDGHYPDESRFRQRLKQVIDERRHNDFVLQMKWEGPEILAGWRFELFVKSPAHYVFFISDGQTVFTSDDEAVIYTGKVNADAPPHQFIHHAKDYPGVVSWEKAMPPKTVGRVTRFLLGQGGCLGQCWQICAGCCGACRSSASGCCYNCGNSFCTWCCSGTKPPLCCNCFGDLCTCCLC